MTPNNTIDRGRSSPPDISMYDYKTTDENTDEGGLNSLPYFPRKRPQSLHLKDASSTTSPTVTCGEIDEFFDNDDEDLKSLLVDVPLDGFKEKDKTKNGSAARCGGGGAVGGRQRQPSAARASAPPPEETDVDKAGNEPVKKRIKKTQEFFSDVEDDEESEIATGFPNKNSGQQPSYQKKMKDDFHVLISGRCENCCRLKKILKLVMKTLDSFFS